MSAAYTHAEGGRTSPEIRLAGQIERFGVLAVMGRTILFAREYYAIRAAEVIVSAYRSRAKSDNWAAWANEHPELSQILFDAQQEK